MSSPCDKVNNFDFIRFFAATLVIYSHDFALKGLSEPVFLKYETFGGAAVLIFFSISGYLVSQSWSRDPNVLRFLLRRWLRIWPGLAAVVLIAAFALGPLTTTLPLSEYFHHPVFRAYFSLLVFKNDVFLPGTFTGNAYAYIPNGALWTIPLEVKCYLILGMLGLVGILRYRWIVLAIFSFLALYYFGFMNAERDIDANRHPRDYLLEFLIFFLAGCVLNYFADEIWKRKPACALAVGYGIGILAIAAHHELIASLLIIPLSAVILGSAKTPVLDEWHRVGDLSYGIYIWGFPIQQTVIWLTHNRWSNTATLAVCYPLTLVFAWLSWHLIEAPALSLKPRKKRQQIVEVRETILQTL